MTHADIKSDICGLFERHVRRVEHMPARNWKIGSGRPLPRASLRTDRRIGHAGCGRLGLPDGVPFIRSGRDRQSGVRDCVSRRQRERSVDDVQRCIQRRRGVSRDLLLTRGDECGRKPSRVRDAPGVWGPRARRVTRTGPVSLSVAKAGRASPASMRAASYIGVYAGRFTARSAALRAHNHAGLRRAGTGSPRRAARPAPTHPSVAGRSRRYVVPARHDRPTPASAEENCADAGATRCRHGSGTTRACDALAGADVTRRTTRSGPGVVAWAGPRRFQCRIRRDTRSPTQRKPAQTAALGRAAALPSGVRRSLSLPLVRGGQGFAGRRRRRGRPCRSALLDARGGWCTRHRRRPP